MEWIGIALAVAVGVFAVLWRMRQRGLDRWIIPYLLQTPKRRRPSEAEDVHLILCFADHFEPRGGNAPPEQARARVDRWVQDYPRQFGAFRDSDGRSPRHTFFYPIEEYDSAHVDAMAELCRAGFGEVEFHLHHDNDSAAHLRQMLLHFKEVFAQRHGLLARHRKTGMLAYGFIHGNWALCNARRDGRWCGVNEELNILRETGCYADFTMPSAPHPTQTSKINSLYYAVNRPGRPRSHETGLDAGSGPQPEGSLLLVQGPLLYDWRNRKCGVLPRLENGCVQGSQPAAIQRVDTWLQARVQVPGRPAWFFAKLHAHGAEETSQDALLGASMAQFHQALADRAAKNLNFRYHYVTAREMYNLVKAAQAGWKGSIADALDFELAWNGADRSSHQGNQSQSQEFLPAHIEHASIGDAQLGNHRQG
jgi:hypothetical protein